MIELSQLDRPTYQQEKENVQRLVRRIWKQEDARQAIHSIERWAQNPESGTYFYIQDDGIIIGITGYFIPNMEQGDFGLRHHGITRKGKGREALDVLVDTLQNKYGIGFRRLIELVPEGRDDLIKKFQEWGFVLGTEVPSWEPKKDYYKYVLVKEINHQKSMQR